MLRSIYKTIPGLQIIFIITLFFNGCSEDNKVEPIPPAKVQIIVKSGADSIIIAGANVVLYNANSGESLSRSFSGSNGIADFENLSAGNFYTKISAQGFRDIPQGNVSPVPFSVSSGKTLTLSYYMNVLPGTFGKIEGNINPAVAGVLVIANSMNTSAEFHSYSGPDGYFVLHNIPYDIYKVEAFKSGYQTSSQPQVEISSTSVSVQAQITINQISGSALDGRVTFLASENGIVDISILEGESLSAINGLSTMIDSSRNYSISKIPNGNFVAWASYKNDGYVMDPDWIFKNPGVLNISFNNDTSGTVNFSVTDAITIISPSNTPQEIIPERADSIVPTFYWNAYPQTKEYIIEVRDINGNLIWGGFTETGEIRHTQIPKEKTSIEFNFDGSASEQLVSGNIYQWRLYSDDDAALDVQTLLSASEDLMGLFIAP